MVGGLLPSPEAIYVYSDGAARGNPGPAAIGYAIYDAQGNVMEHGAKLCGRLTNNEAEYMALLWAVERALPYAPKVAHFHLDSELVVRQMTGRYRVRADNLRSPHREVMVKIAKLERFTISHVHRTHERLQQVDTQVNGALDEEAA